jgi:hypothetical protein
MAALVKLSDPAEEKLEKNLGGSKMRYMFSGADYGLVRKTVPLKWHCRGIHKP